MSEKVYLDNIYGREEFRKYRNQKMTQEEVGKLYNLPASSISQMYSTYSLKDDDKWEMYKSLLPKIEKQLEEGIKQADISQSLEVNIYVIRCLILIYNLKGNRSASISKFTNKEWLQEQVSMGISNAQIAKNCGASPLTIGRYLNKFGIKEKRSNKTYSGEEINSIKVSKQELETLIEKHGLDRKFLMKETGLNIYQLEELIIKYDLGRYPSRLLSKPQYSASSDLQPTKEELKEALENKLSLADIAHLYSTNIGTISKLLRDHGLHPTTVQDIPNVPEKSIIPTVNSSHSSPDLGFPLSQLSIEKGTSIPNLYVELNHLDAVAYGEQIFSIIATLDLGLGVKETATLLDIDADFILYIQHRLGGRY